MPIAGQIQSVVAEVSFARAESGRGEQRSPRYVTRSVSEDGRFKGLRIQRVVKRSPSLTLRVTWLTALLQRPSNIFAPVPKNTSSTCVSLKPSPNAATFRVRSDSKPTRANRTFA